jgi:hypothetical protein
VIVASVGLLLVSVGLLVVGLVSGATPVLLACIGAALAALVPLTVAVVRARPQGGAHGPRPQDRAATDPAGADPSATGPSPPAPDPPDPSTA